MKQLKRCTTCGHLIPVNVKKCPYCSADSNSNTGRVEREEKNIEEVYEEEEAEYSEENDESSGSSLIYFVIACILCLLFFGYVFTNYNKSGSETTSESMDSIEVDTIIADGSISNEVIADEPITNAAVADESMPIDAEFEEPDFEDEDDYYDEYYDITDDDYVDFN